MQILLISTCFLPSITFLCASLARACTAFSLFSYINRTTCNLIQSVQVPPPARPGAAGPARPLQHNRLPARLLAGI